MNEGFDLYTRWKRRFSVMNANMLVKLFGPLTHGDKSLVLVI